MATIKLFKHHFRVPFLLLLIFEVGVMFLSTYLGLVMRFRSFTLDFASLGFPDFILQASMVAFALLL